MNNQDNPQQATPKSATVQNSLKAVAMEIFKKSQRLPPISLLMRKRGQGTKRQRTQRPLRPPHPFEFADFYHL